MLSGKKGEQYRNKMPVPDHQACDMRDHQPDKAYRADNNSGK